jgi:general secretion pathway protein C
MPRTNVYTLVELLLLSLLAIQCARLVWTALTPVGPIGDWKSEAELRPAATASAGLLGSFDPFFRLGGANGPVVITALDLALHGIRQDQASGRGSAIIATPDGVQRSFAVGEEIVPGVTLSSVEFDSVTISRGGVPEQLFMDQSPEAQVVGPAGAPPAAAPPQGPPQPQIIAPPPMIRDSPQPPPPNPVADIGFQPRTDGGRVTGVTVSPRGSGDGFRAAGLAPGDVVVAVNGRRITSAEQAGAIGSQVGARGVTIQVERDGRVITLRQGSPR